MSKEKQLSYIVEEIFKIDNPKIAISKKEQIYASIKTTVNGDASIESYLIVSLSTNNKPVVFGYILTNVRLIQFEINPNGDISSVSYILNKIIGGVERNITDNGNRIDARIKFSPNGTIVGLKYSSVNQEITNFFEKVEQTWIKGSQDAR